MAGEPRRVENEATFRDTNESIRAVVARSPAVLPLVPFICECSDPACRELIRMTLGDYDRARETPRRFVIVRGHLDRIGSESRVVQTSDEFLIIEKESAAGEVADARADTGRGDG